MESRGSRQTDVKPDRLEVREYPFGANAVRAPVPLPAPVSAPARQALMRCQSPSPSPFT